MLKGYTCICTCR